MNPLAAKMSDAGHTRRYNEDTVAIWEPADELTWLRSGCLYVVADGIGGAPGGGVASAYAAAKVLHDYYAAPAEDISVRLAGAIENAGRALHEYNQGRPGQPELAATLVAAAVTDGILTVANVGGGRVYLVRAGASEQITRDHTVVAAMVERGEISSEQAASHPWRNRLTRCLGADADVRVDVFRRELEAGDVLVLCSDGLTRHVSEAEIAAAAAAGEAMPLQLVSQANAAGGLDNISVITVLLRPGERPGLVRASTPNLPPAPDLGALYRTATARPRWLRSFFGR